MDACDKVGYSCQRADDIWEKTTIFQDVLSLICCSKIVILISQILEHVPSDLQGHRIQTYHNN